MSLNIKTCIYLTLYIIANFKVDSSQFFLKYITVHRTNLLRIIPSESLTQSTAQKLTSARTLSTIFKIIYILQQFIIYNQKQE